MSTVTKRPSLLLASLGLKYYLAMINLIPLIKQLVPFVYVNDINENINIFQMKKDFYANEKPKWILVRSIHRISFG